jgi:putative ABC transport system substrate-binding protein
MRVRPGGLLLLFILGMLALPLAAEAQQPAKTPRIGVLSAGSASDTALRLRLEAFRQGLRERGWIEGQNVVLEYRWGEGRYDRLADLAAELVRLKVDVIFAPGTAVTTAAQNATRTIPIIMTSVGDPVGRGTIASLARPGGNVTGLSFSVGFEIVGKQLELLKEVVPKVSRVAVPGNPGNPAHGPMLREAQVAGRSLGVQLQVLEARGPNEFDRAFAAMVKQRVGALLVLSDAVYLLLRTPLAQLAGKSRLLTIYGFREHVDAGGLLAYGPNLSDLFGRAATYVDKILKGAKAADLPVEQPTKFELIINLKTAKALGLTIPQSLLGRADEVIQ